MLHDNMKVARVGAGLKKTEVAQRLNIPYTTYNGYETGKRSPDPNFLPNIAEALGVSVNFLLYGRIKAIAFGQRIQVARQAKSMSQQELADKINVSVADMQQFEIGLRKPTIEQQKELAGLLNVNVSFFSDGYMTTQYEYDVGRSKFGDDTWPELLEDAEERSPGPLVATLPGDFNEPCDAWQDDAMHLLNRLNPDGRAKAIELLEILAKVPDYQWREG